MKTKNEAARSEHLALAPASCSFCDGSGMSSRRSICNCVYRGIFRVVMNKFRDCAEGNQLVRPVPLDGISKRVGSRTFGHKAQEFCADVHLTARRTLTNEMEWDVFRFHFLYGAEWKPCCKRLNIDRGAFFHTVYRIERKLGRVFLELRPFAIYPVAEYFSGCSKIVDARALVVPCERYTNGKPLVPPMRPLPQPAPQPQPAAPEPSAPEPEPVPVVVADDVALAREWYRAGKSMRVILAELRLRGITCKGPAGVRSLVIAGLTEPTRPLKWVA